MRIAINIWSFPSDMQVRECFTVAKDAGFEGFELAIAESGPVNLQTSEAELVEYRKMANDMGLELTSLASGLGWSLPLTDERDTVRARGLDAVKRQIEAAAVLEVDTILVVPGVVGAEFLGTDVGVDYDVAYDRALEAMQELAPLAEASGVYIGVENVWNKFLLSPLEMRGFLDSVNSPYVGAFFDVGNVVAFGYPEQWIKILGSRIKKVHVKDYRKQAAGLAGFVDLLAGDVDYPKVVDALNRIGYTDFIIAEMGLYKHHPLQSIYNTAGAMKAILGQKN